MRLNFRYLTTTLAVAAAVLLVLAAGFGQRLAGMLGGTPSHALRVVLQSRVRAATPIPPFTVVRTHYLTSGPGNTSIYRHGRQLAGSSTDAFDTDGSRVFALTTYERTDDAGHRSPAWDTSSIVNMKTHRRIDARPFLNAHSSYPVADSDEQARAAVQPTPESDCLLTSAGQQAFRNRKLTGRETVLGFDTVILSTPDGDTRDWRAPALGCALLQTIRIFRNSTGAIVSTNEQMATSVTVGPINPQLFNPPGDELKPSDIYKRQLALWEKPWGLNAADLLSQEAPKLAKQDLAYAVANGQASQ
jgi:hypothetical protein